MRHGIAFRKLNRTSTHRNLMLRNMVSSLLEHEQIQTTVAKAQEASRLAEWVITWGKGGTEAQRHRARGFLMNPDRTMPKLFTELAARYATRPGGYTRIHTYGHRKGDHAATAILELVDNPNDLRFHMTARIAGRELAKLAHSSSSCSAEVMKWAVDTLVPDKRPAVYSNLSDRTLKTVKKVLRPDNASKQQSQTSEPVASTSTNTSDPARLSLARFDTLVREAFFRTTAISKVPQWTADTERYEDLLLNAEDSHDSAPVTRPGHGRKVWAGQEDIERRYGARKTQVADKDAWEDEADATTSIDAETLRARSMENLKKKLRHPEGRNGAYGQRSPIARAKGHQAAPRSLRERFERLDMPSVPR